MPVGLPEEDPDWSALTLYADSEVSIVFTPFDTANLGARVMTEPPSLRTSTAPPYRDYLTEGCDPFRSLGRVRPDRRRDT